MLFVMQDEANQKTGIVFKKGEEWVSAWLPAQSAYGLGAQLMVAALSMIESQRQSVGEPFILRVSGFAEVVKDYDTESPAVAARLYIQETGAGLDVLKIEAIERE